MKFLLLSLSFGLFFCGRTQSESDTVYYTKLHDNPKFSWIGGGASFDLDLNRYNFTAFAVGFDGIFCTPKFSLNMYSRLHLLERLTNFSLNGQPSVSSIYERERSRDISFLGSYYFKSKISDELNTVQLREFLNVIYVIEILNKEDKRFGIDFGISGGFTYYNFGDAKLDGISTAGISAELFSKTENDAITTVFTQKVLRAGFNRTTSQNVKIKTEQYGILQEKSMAKHYFHVLYGFGQNVDDVLLDVDFSRFDINTNMNWLPLGFGIGSDHYYFKTKKKIATSTQIELGLMPGPFENYFNNFYFDWKVRLHFVKDI